MDEARQEQWLAECTSQRVGKAVAVVEPGVGRS